ncbi:MAG: hypothetical protein Q7R32_12455 [Dehalococcoidia bacterium]|nr:hypothetical protein [Dehalococcoidia bacterium]
MPVVVLAAACGGGGEEVQPTPTPSPTIAQPSPTPSPTPTPGVQRLAYIGTDLDVWIMNEDGSNQQKLFDIATDPGDSVHNLQWSPDGTKFAVTRSPKDVVYIVSAAGEKLLELPAVSFLAWSPSSDTYAVARGPALEVESAVLVLDPRGDTAVELANIQIVDQAYFSPDGRRLTFYEFVGGGGLCGDYRGLLADLQTGEVRPIDPAEPPIPCGKGPPIFSPTNPSLLAYGDGLFDLDAGRVQPLPGRAVRWSPDGRYLVLAGEPDQSDAGVPGQVYSLETAASVLEFEVNVSFASDQPFESLVGGRTTFSSDSRLLASSDLFPDKPAVLHIRDIATGGDKTLSIPAGRFGFQFSPDGRHLLISAATELFPDKPSDEHSIWLVNSDGSNLIRLAEGSEPAWQPQP